MRRVKPGHVYDWATKAAECVDPKASVSRIAAIIALHAEPLVALLREARRSHDKGYNEESCDYPPCPKSDECEANDNMACTCSADAWNARIDAVLAGR